MSSPLALRLRAARKAANLTQQRLGIQLGMDPNTASARINQYDKGKHAPDYQTAQRMAAELDVPVADLYCEEDVLAELICKISKLEEADQLALLDKLK
jgi:transcriptional regulator with XRE-family HTH domain